MAALVAGCGRNGIDFGRGLRFDNSDLTMKAALSGIGVAIGRTPMLDDDLSDGRLVEPFDIALDSECAYHFVVPEATADQPKIQAFAVGC